MIVMYLIVVPRDSRSSNPNHCESDHVLSSVCMIKYPTLIIVWHSTIFLLLNILKSTFITDEEYFIPEPLIA